MKLSVLLVTPNLIIRKTKQDILNERKMVPIRILVELEENVTVKNEWTVFAPILLNSGL